LNRKAGRTKDRRFYSIGEVARLLELETHVIRFWEREFQRYIRPRRIGGRRFYSPEQVKLFQSIKHLLYEEGYTIAGAKKRLGQKDISPSLPSKNAEKLLHEIYQELQNLLDLLEG